MSDHERPDPRDRPADPAGTQPKVDPESLLPQPRPPRPDAVDGDAVEEHEFEFRPTRAPAEEEQTLLPDVREPAGAMSMASEPPEPPHSPRFQFLLGVLLALGAVALAAALALTVGGKSSGGDGLAWSPWKPSKDPVTSISDHVGAEYRLPDGEQLVAVTGSGLEIAGLPMTIALRHSAAQGGDISLLSGKGVLYRLCGLGPKCAIDKGKPSTERHLLLRREALELALYTFRYVKDIKQVVVFMPPKLGDDPNQALLFRKGDVQPELARPLQATLARHTPSVAGVATSPDSPLVNRLTTATLYTFSLTQGNQDANVFLVLEPFDASSATSSGATSSGATGSGGSSSGGSSSGASSSGSGGSGSGSSSAKTKTAKNP